MKNLTTSGISWRAVLVGLLHSVMLTGCGGGGDSGGQDMSVSTTQPAAPAGLAYGSDSVIYVQGQAISPNSPTSSGGVITQYSVAPPLPTGLGLDPLTGVISGTPLAVTPTATYTVTGKNIKGSVTVQLQMEVTDSVKPPKSLMYSPASISVPKGIEITPLTPTMTGGGITKYAVSPRLPDGLTLNELTGAISGMPTIASVASNYTIMGSNRAGMVSTIISIAVEPYSHWLPVGDMKIPVYSPVATLLQDGKVLIAGGADGPGNSLKKSMLFDPTSRTWSFTGDLNATRESHSLTLLRDGTVLLAGGYQAQARIGEIPLATPLGTTELYSSAKGSWVVSGDLGYASPRKNYTATLLADGNVLFVPGRLYHSDSKSWSDMDLPYTLHQNHTSTLLANGKVLVAGGKNNVGTLRFCELYDPTTDTWSTTGKMSVPRQNHTAVLLANGKVLVAGGIDGEIDGDSTTYSSAELYDPETGAWSPAGDMTSSRVGHTMTRLNDGRVLVAGGRPKLAFNVENLASSEIFDPKTNSWTNTERMRVARTNHSATLLTSGYVLVAGGHGASEAYASSELFVP